MPVTLNVVAATVPPAVNVNRVESAPPVMMSEELIVGWIEKERVAAAPALQVVIAAVGSDGHAGGGGARIDEVIVSSAKYRERSGIRSGDAPLVIVMLLLPAPLS